MKRTASKIYNKLCISIGVTKETYPSQDELLKARIVFGVQLTYLGAWAFYVLLYSILGAPINALLCLFLGIPSVMFGIYVFIKSKSTEVGTFISSGCALIILSILTLTTGGIRSPILGWMLAVIIVTFLQIRRRYGIMFTLFTLQIMLILHVYELLNGELPYLLPFSETSTAYSNFTLLTQFSIVVSVTISTLIYSNLITIGFKESQTARDRAQQAAQAKGDFMAMMSHEIRTPMNVMMGMVSLLEDTVMDNEQQRCLNTISYSVDGLTTIVNDVLDFSKIEALRLEIEMKTFNVRNLMDGITEMFGAKAREKKINFGIMIDHCIPTYLIGDMGRIRQVLINFVGNAMKFTDTGDISVKIQILTHGNFGCNIRFSVKDTGIGIPEDKHHKIFQPFEQVDSSINRKYGGTGLGLSICKRLTELMGGTISFESQSGCGTTFMIDLPLTSEEDHDTDTNSLESVSIFHRGGIEIEQDQIREFALTYGAKYFLVDEYDKIPDISSGINVIIEDERSLSPNCTHPRIILTANGNKHISYGENSTISLLKPLTISLLHEGIKIVTNQNSIEHIPADKTPKDSRTFEKIQNARILLVEDNPYNVKVARKILEKYECKISVAENGIEAIDLFLSETFDLILMDMQMPEMNGIQATRIIRKNESERKDKKYTPIIAMTANVLEDDRERYEKAGIDDHLAKPFRKNQLYDIVAKNINLE